MVAHGVCREHERKGVQWDVEMVGARGVQVDRYKKGLARKLVQGAWVPLVNNTHADTMN